MVFMIFCLDGGGAMVIELMSEKHVLLIDRLAEKTLVARILGTKGYQSPRQ
jgi:hypothetical protein